MKRILFLAAALAATASGAVFAQEFTAPPAEAAKTQRVTALSTPAPLVFNLGVVSDYRFRGISQTRLGPAIQGGVDYTHGDTGLYAGLWMSSIMWTKDAGGSGSLELDIYGGKKGKLSDNTAYDVGVLTYVYPSNGLQPNANTTELYAQLGYGPAYLKYSSSMTNLFGYTDSKYSGYLDAGANIDLVDKLVLNLHAGHQQVKHNSKYSYSDWKIGLTKDFEFVTAAISAIGTTTTAYRGPSYDNKNLGHRTIVLSVLKTF